MKRMMTVMAIWTAVTAAALAQSAPTTEPASDQAVTRGRFGGRGFAAEREMEEAGTFLREHAPNRWQMIQLLPEDGAIRRSVMAFVVARYRVLMEVKKDDPKLYDLKVEQFATEDELYGLAASNKTREDREKVRDQIRANTQKLMELNIAERQRRIERLTESLKSEEERLETDRSAMPRHVNNRVEAIVNEGPAAMRWGGMGMRREPGKPHPATQPER